METLFAACAPGLEGVLAGELASLGLRKAAPFFKPPERLGGLEFEGDLAALYRANFLLRGADRVRVRAGRFSAPTFDALAAAASRLPWEKFLAPGRPVAARADCRGSRLYHERAVAEAVVKAVSARLGRPSALATDEGAARVYARVEKDVCTLEVDSSGAPLHRRGYRLATAKAPLRETLAASLVLASGWDGTSPFLDPFCGSGTIAIEAALMARRAPPGRGRRFAFMDWPGFDAALWERIAAEITAPPAASPVIQASDRDAGAIAAARANAERAGVGAAIDFSCRAVSAAAPPRGPGWVVTNPPYGERVAGGRDLRDLYAQFGKVLRAQCPEWRATMLCPTAALARATGLDFGAGFPTMNGGLDVRIFHYRP